jgi:hypothetical protein
MNTSRFTHAVLLAAALLAPIGMPVLERGASAQARPAQADHRTLAADDHDGDHDFEGRKASSPLVRTARESTQRYQNVTAAEADGYALMFGCVSGPEWGAMGLHYVNLPLVLDGELDPTRPEIVIYEPLENGTLRLVGADYLVFKDAWHAKTEETPKLMGQLMHLFESPNRYGLPPFYTLHVWAWKDNPNGSFVNWHPKVSCDAYRAPGQ